MHAPSHSDGKTRFAIHRALAAFALCAAVSVASGPACAAGTNGHAQTIPSTVDFPFLDQLGSIRTDAVSKFDIAGFKLGTSRDDAEKKIIEADRNHSFGDGVTVSLGLPMGMNVSRGFFCRHYRIDHNSGAPNLSLVYTIHQNCEFIENSYSPSPAKSFLLSVIRYDQRMTSGREQYISKLIAKYGMPESGYRDSKNPQIFSLFWGYRANTALANYVRTKHIDLTGNNNNGYTSTKMFINYLNNIAQGYLADRVPDNAKCEALMKQRKETPQSFSDHNGIDDDVFNCFTAATKKKIKVAMTDLAPVMMANSTTDGVMHIYLASPALYASQQVFEKYLGLGENYGPMHLWLMHKAYAAKMNSKAHTAF